MATSTTDFKNSTEEVNIETSFRKYNLPIDAKPLGESILFVLLLLQYIEF